MASAGIAPMVWAVIGIVLVVAVAATLYFSVTGALAGGGGAVVNVRLPDPNNLQVIVRNPGTGNVVVDSVTLYDSSGNPVTGCALDSAYLDGSQISTPGNPPWSITVRGGGYLDLRYSGGDCAKVVRVSVETSAGIFTARPT